ncbi:MAG: M48 family metallopeptidase, partial [Burkholderiales bacterium]
MLLTLAPLSGAAQGTRIEAPKNGYTVAQDVQLGRQASAEVRQQLPTLPENGEADAYVERVGRRLVAAIPRQFAQPQFQYSFDVVNAREINAFALPGGPMFVNRGMIEAARSEGEMAGVMAHEISHVALRHGTAQATKAQKLQLPALGGAILGAIIGGNVGGLIAQGTQLGLGAYLLKYSREYETQADLLGAQIMANAGYDPRDLANMFRTIEREGGGSGPEWLSSHPNPGNRYERINEEASRLRVDARARGGDGEFNRVKSSLSRMAAAPTMEEIARNQPRTSQDRQYPADSRIEQRVESPSSRYRTFSGGNAFRLAVPENWREFGGDGNEVTFAPRGAYGAYRNQTVFTHGVVAGLVNPQSRNLREASDRYTSALLQSNPYLESRSGYRRGRLGNANALSRTFYGRSPATGRPEAVTVHTALLRDGSLFYLITV